jgi:hypothetical protein
MGRAENGRGLDVRCPDASSRGAGTSFGLHVPLSICPDVVRALRHCGLAYSIRPARCGPCGQAGRSAGAACARVPTLEGTSFVLRKAAPDTGVLAGVERPTQARLDDLASTANGLGFLDLKDRWPCVPDREEQLRVLLEAGCLMAPVHGMVHSSRPQGGSHFVRDMTTRVNAPRGFWPSP